MKTGRSGRPSKLTPELQDEICKYIKDGYTIAQAAALSGITERTFYLWKKRGENSKSGKYFEFLQQVKMAQKIAEAKFIDVIKRAAMGDRKKKIRSDWRAAKWYLSVINPKEFGKREYIKQEVSHDKDDEGVYDPKLIREIGRKLIQERKKRQNHSK